MAFVGTNDTREIRADWWQDWERVTIRKWTISQRDKLNEQIVKITGGTSTESITEMQIRAAQVPVLEAGVESWTFTKDDTEDGKRVPVSPQWIERLDPNYADFIVTEIWAFNQRMGDDERASFLE